jgi:ADP-ribose pyrophosphatase YjhB (NUDIX family)
MAKSSKLVAARKGRVLLVRRRRDRLWMFPGGRRRVGESERKCLRREIGEELPKLKVGLVKLWKEVKAKNRRSGRKMSDAIFIAKKVSGRLKIGDKREIDKAVWRKPHAHVALYPRQVVSEAAAVISMLCRSKDRKIIRNGKKTARRRSFLVQSARPK